MGWPLAVWPVMAVYSIPYKQIAHICMHPRLHEVALALGYNHLGDFYAQDGTLHVMQDLHAQALKHRGAAALHNGL